MFTWQMKQEMIAAVVKTNPWSVLLWQLVFKQP